MSDRKRTGGSGLLDQLPTARLAEQGQQLLGLLAEQAIEKAVVSVEGLAERLIDYAHHGEPGLIAAITGRGGGGTPAETKPPLSVTVRASVTNVSESVKQALSGVSGARKSGRVAKTMNIAEQIDVGVPVRLAYDQWTQFQDFPQFMKTVNAVEKISDGASNWQVQIFCSHRNWDATIIEQIPDERIVWRSEGVKGHVDGAVSFHALTPNMTRILLALECYPRGLLERAGELWHAQGRRVRVEINKFRHHVMTCVVLSPDSVQGWRGEIRDSKVVRTHEEAIAAEAQDDDYDDVADPHEDDAADPYDADADDPYDEDADADEEYDDEPEREYAPSGGGNR